MGNTSSQKGPLGQRIWKEFDLHGTSNDWSEYMLYSDSRIGGHLEGGLGPYHLYTSFGDQKILGISQPALCLRIEHPDVEWKWSVDVKTNDEFYHGGLYTDEIASIISLLLGVRLKAGPQSRMMIDDPRGKPVNWDSWKKPLLSPKINGRAILPNVFKDAVLNLETPHIDLLKSYRTIQAESAVALARAARLYQEAIWIAETDPSTTWLLLVSAVESAAHHWTVGNETEISLFEKHYPTLTKRILDQSNPGLLRDVAKEFAPISKATNKFLKFSLEFMPEPPPKRALFAILDWQGVKLEKVLKYVYTYRSKALHSGKPFPVNMNDIPENFDGLLTEKPIGLGMRSLGGEWDNKDTPIILNTYEFVVRGILLNWWKSLTVAPSSTLDQESVS